MTPAARDSSRVSMAVATHELVQQAVEGVVSLTHRGAVNADPNTGDGAGVTIQIPYAVLQPELERLGHPDLVEQDLALAMVFLPRDEHGTSARTQAA